MAIVYSDLFILALVPIVLHAFALAYLFMVRKYLGLHTVLIFVGLNGFMIVYAFIISYALWLAAQRATVQPIEVIGVYVGFIMPLSVGALHLWLQRRVSLPFRKRPRQ